MYVKGNLKKMPIQQFIFGLGKKAMLWAVNAVCILVSGYVCLDLAMKPGKVIEALTNGQAIDYMYVDAFPQ